MANSTKISEYSTTAANNTSIDSIDIDENCAASGINNALRSVLKHQADAFTQGAPIALDQTNNRVGLGNTAPETILHATASSAIIRLTSDANGTSGVDFGDSDDTNIGRLLYDNSDNSMRLTTNTNEQMRIDAGGSVLLGTTTPTDLHNTWRHIIIGDKGAIISQDGAGGVPGMTIADNAYFDADTGSLAYQTTDQASKFTQEAGSFTFSNAASGTAGAGLSLTERMRIQANGCVTVGYADETNTQQFASHTSATNVAAVDARSTSTSYTNQVLLVGSNTNTTNSTYNHIRCDIHGVAQKMAVRDSGNLVNANNSYGSLSDSRLKENIVDAASQWDDIKALQVRKYNRLGETQKELGVIAQELEASGMGGLVEEGPYYDAVNNPNEETRKSVKYSVLYMKAIKALQEAITKIETLETEMTALKARVTALEA